MAPASVLFPLTSHNRAQFVFEILSWLAHSSFQDPADSIELGFEAWVCVRAELGVSLPFRPVCFGGELIMKGVSWGVNNPVPRLILNNKLCVNVNTWFDEATAERLSDDS